MQKRNIKERYRKGIVRARARLRPYTHTHTHSIERERETRKKYEKTVDKSLHTYGHNLNTGKIVKSVIVAWQNASNKVRRASNGKQS